MRRGARAWWLLPAAAVTILDLWSKSLWTYPPRTHYEVVIENWLYIRTVWNQGGVWSLPIGRPLLLAATAAAVPALLVWLFAPRRAEWHDSLGKALVLGGAAGNLWDRFWFNGEDEGVRDFIDVCFGDVDGWHWPTFNVADIALVVGIGVLLLGSFRRHPAKEGA